MAIMKTIRSKYSENADFDPDKIKQASTAAEGLCSWVLAMEEYDRLVWGLRRVMWGLSRGCRGLCSWILAVVEYNRLVWGLMWVWGSSVVFRWELRGLMRDCVIFVTRFWLWRNIID